ncbi:MAG: hypothetical protein ACF8OB_16960 [Phycisphaeraceae bacterium JB051]
MRNTIIEKSRRRLLVLTMGTLFVSLFGGGLFALNQWQSDKQYQLMRHDVQLAIQQERYDDAIEQLTHGLAYWPDDSQLLQDYVNVQKHVQYMADQNLALTIEVLNRSLESNPQMQQAAAQLVQLHMITGDASQALKVADMALAIEPDNTQMIKRRAFANIRLGSLTQAIEDVDRCIAISPTDYELYLLRLYLAKLQHAPASQMTELVSSWHDTLQSKAWQQALMGVSCRLNELDEQAISWFKQAAIIASEDARLLQLLIRQLDSLGEYQTADALLDSVDVVALPTLLYEKAWRLWQNKSDDALLQLDAQDQPAVMALQLLVSKRQGQKQSVDALLLQFGTLPPTAANRHWGKLMHLLVKDQDSHPLQWIEAVQQVRMSTSNHDLAELVLAQQYERLGELAASLDVWRALSHTSPRWTLPYLQQSRLLLESGHPMASAAVARQALASDPESTQAGVLLVEALAKSHHKAAREMAVSVFESIAESLPADMCLLLEARIMEPAKVRQKVDRAIHHKMVTSKTTWLELAQISLDRQGDWHDACLKEYEVDHVKTPRWLLLKAIALQEQGQDVAARELINQTVERQTQQETDQSLAWLVTQAQYLSMTTDLLASHVAWQHLLASYPRDLSVCQAVLNLPEDQLQPQLRQRAINQLRQLTGPSAIRWRYEQAVLMLKQSSDNATLTQATLLLHDALKLTPSAIDCRLLLLKCLATIGSEQGMIEQAHAILQVDPYHAEALEILKQARR